MRHLIVGLAALGAACGGEDPTDSDSGLLDDDTSEVDTDSTGEDPLIQPVICEAFGGSALLVEGDEGLYTAQGYTGGVDGFTVELWLRPDRTPDSQEWRALDWTQGRTATETAERARTYWVVDVLQGGEVQFESHTATDDPLVASVPGGAIAEEALPSGEWTHVAAVIDSDAGEVRVYLNGVLSRSESPAPEYFDNGFGVTHQLYIGRRGSMSFRGQIDDVRLWTAARTQQAIRDDLCTHFGDDAAPAGLADQHDFEADDFTSWAGLTMVIEGTPTRIAR